MSKPCYIFDIDGTVADLTHRMRYIDGTEGCKDWNSFFDACVGDAPIEHMCDLARTLSRSEAVVFVSGRSDRVRKQTIKWLNLYVSTNWYLYMRREGDHRPDTVIKKELLNQLYADGFEPIMAFEDRASVVKMWRDNGIPCAQVAEGEF